jgi:hypothetical protein
MKTDQAASGLKSSYDFYKSDGKIDQQELKQLIHSAVFTGFGTIGRAEADILLSALDEHLSSGEAQKVDEVPDGAEEVGDISPDGSSLRTAIYNVGSEVYIKHGGGFSGEYETYKLDGSPEGCAPGHNESGWGGGGCLPPGAVG